MDFKVIFCVFFLLTITAASPFRFSLAETVVCTPPKTDIGAFSVDDITGQVYLYYESLNNLLNKQRNYVVRAMDNDIQFVRAANAIKYTDVIDRDLTIHVYTENVNNELSEFVSTWRVPQRSQRCAKPIELAFSRKSDGIIEIGWKAPTNESERNERTHSIDLCAYITSYTVFWCESQTQQPNSCDGVIQFKRIPAKRISREYTYQLKVDNSFLSVAVSANSFDSSSGMVWLNTSD